MSLNKVETIQGCHLVGQNSRGEQLFHFTKEGSLWCAECAYVFFFVVVVFCQCFLILTIQLNTSNTSLLLLCNPEQMRK